MIKIRDISKKYKKRYIIKNLNYEFNDVGLYLVTGKSGKGKTTLLNIIGNVDHKYEGKIYSDNNILYFKDKNILVSSLSVKDNIYLFEKIYDIKINDYFNIKDFYKKKIKKLSLGERQLVILTIALNSKEKSIILDEPFSALSINNLEKACLLIEEMSKEKLIILVSHNISYFKEYSKLNMEKYSRRKIKDFDSLYIDDKKKYKISYYLFYLKKILFKKMMFIFSIIFIFTSFYKVREYSKNIENDYLEGLEIESGNVIYRKNVLKEINEDIFYEVVKRLSLYISNYNINYYSEKLYDKDLSVDNYYIDNAFVLSSIEYIEKNMKDNEIVLGLNYHEFCMNNRLYYCDESYINTLLINKKINEFNYYISEIFASESTRVLSNKRFNKILSNNTYIEYYLDIKKEYINEAFKLINSDDLLNEFTFAKVGELDNEYRYILKLENKSYYYPFYYNDYIVCLDKGYDCFNYINHMSSLVKIDSLDENINFNIIDNKLELNEIVISSLLSEKLNKNINDNITLYFDYKGNIKNINFIIKNIINSNKLSIYQNSSFSYLLFKDLLKYDNEDLIIKNILVYENVKEEDEVSDSLYKDVLNEIKSMFNKMNNIINFINVGITFSSLLVLLFLEYFYNKFKKEYKNYLKFLKIK